MTVALGQGDVNDQGDKEVTLKRADGTSLLGLALSAAALPIVLATDSADVPVISPVARHCLDGNLYATNFSRSLTTGNLRIFLLRNPASSGKLIVVQDVEVAVDLGATTSQLNQIKIEFRENPTVTGAGSASSILNLRIGSSNTAVATIGTNPSVSAAGNLLMFTSTINKTFHLKEFGMITLEEGNDLYVIMKANATPNTALVNVRWAEVPV